MKQHSVRTTCCLLLLLLILWASPLECNAATTTLTIQLPEFHTIDLNIRGRGSVSIGDAHYSHSASIEMPRLSSFQLQVIPQKGSHIHSILYNGEAQQPHNGQYTLDISALTEDVVLEVRFRTDSTIPNTGDAVLLPACALFLSGTMLVLICQRKRI